MRRLLFSAPRFAALIASAILFAVAGCSQDNDGNGSCCGRSSGTAKNNQAQVAASETAGCPACAAAAAKSSTVKAGAADTKAGTGPECCAVGDTPTVATTPTVPNKDAGIKLEVVKYDQLEAALKAQHGKIIVLDIWANYCIPCKKEFPNLVKLHERYAKDGLVCMSLTVDEPSDRDAALAFLKSRGATFGNYLIDEKPDVWQEKFDITGVPAVLVFDREGKRLRKFDGDDPDHHFTYADVEKLVVELLKPAQ